MDIAHRPYTIWTLYDYDSPPKEIVADIIDLAKEGNDTIISNYSLNRLLKELAEIMATSIKKANNMSRKLSTIHLQS